MTTSDLARLVRKNPQQHAYPDCGQRYYLPLPKKWCAGAVLLWKCTTGCGRVNHLPTKRCNT